MSGSYISRTLRSFMARLAGTQFDGARDLYLTFGYPRVVPPEQYREIYTRGDISARIIDAFPEATWREPPAVRKRDAPEGDAWEKSVEALADRLQLWSTLQRLDTLTGLGHYGVMFLGLDGAEDPSLPTGRNYGRLLYLTPHGETSAQVTTWDNDPKSPRYGQPLTYRLTSGPAWAGAGGASRSLAAHWSRCIHVAERALEDNSIGQPRLERIINRCLDLEKLLGGSAEVWWQNAAMLRAWVADADTQFDPDTKAEMEAQLEELQHQLRRDVRLRGVTPHNLASDAQSNNAAAIIDKELDFVSGATGIPKRILIGSERGELSSEQDENNWAARVVERRNNHATPRMVRPFIDRCIALGLLENPGEYDVVWPESDTLGEAARADIASKKATAVAVYVGTPGTDSVVAPQEFRRWLGEDEESEFDLAPEPDDDPLEGVPLDEDPEAIEAFNQRAVLIADEPTT